MGNLDGLSIYLSMLLRHRPQEAHITLDEHGWADEDELLAGVNSTGRKIDMSMLEENVATDKKQRYSFSPDKTLIRANQGHSIPVDVEPKEQEPPELLGQIAKNRNCIKKGNELDYSKAAALVIDEFRSGRLGKITLEFPGN